MPPDVLLPVMADLGHLLDDLLVDLDPEAVPGRALPVSVVEVEDLRVLDVAQELVAEEGDPLLLDQDVWCREVDLERCCQRHRAERAMWSYGRRRRSQRERRFAATLRFRLPVRHLAALPRRPTGRRRRTPTVSTGARPSRSGGWCSVSARGRCGGSRRARAPRRRAGRGARARERDALPWSSTSARGRRARCRGRARSPREAQQADRRSPCPWEGRSTA